MRPRVEAFVASFNREPELVQDFTSDKRKLADALGELYTSGDTALLDTIIATADYAQEKGKQRRKALIVFTDGLGDNSSVKKKEVIEAVKDSCGRIEPATNGFKPTILHVEKAKYTEEARQNHVQGEVILSLVLTCDERITDIRVIRGLPEGLTEKAIEAAKKTRFKPAVRNGAPVSVRMTFTNTFALY
jgi:TonB family protein